MSKKQAIAFFEEISKNQQLAQAVEKVLKGKNSDEAKTKELISLAKKHHFIFTPEDAKNAQEELKKPLSTEELLEVSGGKLNLKSSLMAAAMLLGLGASGAALHSMEASAMKRSAPHQNNGKRGKIDPPNTTQQGDHLFAEAIMRYVQGRSAETNETQQQTTPQPVGGQQQTAPQTCELTNLTQRQTTPSNDQGSAQSDSQQATRGTPHSRPRTTSDEEEHAPRQLNESEKHDREAAKRFSDVYGCGYHQVDWSRRVSASGALPAADWPAAPSADLEAENRVCRFCGGTLSARGENARDVKCANAGCIYNWVFPPTGDKKLKGNQRGQKDYGHCARWALLPALILDSRHKYINSTGNTGRGAARKLAIETPAEAWAVWQLISQRDPVVNGVGMWPAIVEMMDAHDVEPAVQSEVIQLLEESYNNLVQGNDHLRAIGLGSEVQQLVKDHNNGWQNFIGAMMERGYGSEEVKEAITKMINSYHMLTDEQLQQADYDPTGIRRDATTASAEIDAAHQRFEFARRHEEARRQDIEALQRGEQLTVEQKERIARLVARAGLVTCRAKSAPGGKGCGSSNVHLNAHPRGDNIQFKCNDCGKTFSYQHADLLAMLEEAAPGNAPVEMVAAEPNELQMQMMQTNHILDERDYNTNQMNDNNNNFDVGACDNQMEDQDQMQMMNPNGVGFNFGGQYMNQFNLGQQMMMQNHDDLDNTFIEPYQLQTGGPNDFTFNKGHSHAPILRRLIVYQMDGPQHPVNVQMQNMDQMNDQPQNTQVIQNQQPVNDQADQMAAHPQQNPNENGINWRFNFEAPEDDSLIPGSSVTWLGSRWEK